VGALLGKQGFSEAGILWVDAIQQLDSRGEKFLATIAEQGLNIFTGGNKSRRRFQNEAESCNWHRSLTFCVRLRLCEAAYHGESSKGYEYGRA
jgi:hypothetical protein